ncbi:MAG: hypothetical protein ACRDJI_01165 [Actinomycetota bacterium]
MRRFTVLAALLVVVLAVGPAPASEGSRGVTVEYEAPDALQFADPRSGEGYFVLFGDPPFPTFYAQRGETHVGIEIEDELGKVTAGHIHVDSNRDGQVDAHMSVCGKTEKPLSITPGAKLEIWILSGTCRDGTASIATQGLVTATFHR